MTNIKLAQVRAPKGRRPANPSGQNVAKPGQHLTSSPNTYQPSFSNIKEMQQAILNFAIKAEQTSTTNMQGKEETDPFGNFLVKTYLGGEDPIGKQYLNVDVGGDKNRENASIDNVNLKGIINTIKRIGSPGTEKSVDGIWQTKTNNALKNIFAIAYAVLNAATDMGLSLRELNADKLEEFRKLIPNNYTDISDGEKSSVAKKLTLLINDMGNVFDSFKKFVLQNKKYTKYIEQKKSFVNYKQRPQSGSSLLNEEENKVYLSQVSRPVPNLIIDNTVITLSDLENMQNFKLMMNKIKRNPNDANEISKTIAEISKMLGGNVVPTGIMTNPGY